MPTQLDAAFGCGFTLIGLAAVAAAAGRIATAAFQDEEEGLELLPAISSDKRLELEEKYGRWAVVTAIGVCPHGDLRCIEREAKRLYESRVYRRM